MLRRSLNVSIAGTALLVFAVPLLIVALLIKLTSSGPALFRQRRVGKNGHTFEILKFRTMTADAARGAAITIGADWRITRIGAFLRRSKIDELPQLINVIKGDMNLVGPRPELSEYVEKYSTSDRNVVLSVAPGMTDFASVRFRRESDLLSTVEDPLDFYEHAILPRKLRYARFYVRRASLGTDCYIIGLTICSLFADAFESISVLPPCARRSRRARASTRLLHMP
jgi:lipopolysaccharide/colanic/teichoic acid biosynthesis glycosyltransferase